MIILQIISSFIVTIQIFAIMFLFTYLIVWIYVLWCNLLDPTALQLEVFVLKIKK